MSIHAFQLLPMLLLGVALAACSGQGPEVVDPSSFDRTQTSILAIDGDGGSDLAIVKEPDGVRSTTAYSDANGAPLGRRIDGIFESFDRLFLLHRESASISIVALSTRQKRAEITGFSDSTSSLCGIAFSNLSQGWAIDHDRPSVYQFDAVNAVLVDTLPIEGRPTSVATIGDNVFVGSQLPDGSGLVTIFKSNFATFGIHAQLRFGSPIIFMHANGNEDAMILVSAGAAGGKPTVHSIKATTLQQTAERALNAAPLTGRIGTVPEYATITRDNYLYIATAEQVYRIDVGSSRLSSSPLTWLDGAYDVIGADQWTDLMYAYDATARVLRRLDVDGRDLGPVAVTPGVSAIEFVNPSRVN